MYDTTQHIIYIYINSTDLFRTLFNNYYKEVMLMACTLQNHKADIHDLTSVVLRT